MTETVNKHNKIAYMYVRPFWNNDTFAEFS